MTADRPYISSWAFIPVGQLGKREQLVRNACTVYPRKFGDEAPTPIHVYDTKVPGHLGLPIDWALLNYPDLGFEDRTTEGATCYHHKLPDPNHPRAAPGQEQFMADLYQAAQDYHTVLAKAATGSGKTVVALYTAARLGRRTFIVVHLQRLARQWAHEIHDKLGVPYDDIGWVQGDVCNWEHPFVLIVTKSLAIRHYPPEMHGTCGTLIVDECHRLGAPTFARTVGMFAARHKIFLTATDKRKDGCDKVFHYYAGKPKVIAAQPALAATVHSIEYPCNVPFWMKNPGQFAARLSEDFNRNDVLCRLIMSMYRRGRNILVIGDRVEHLQTLMKMSIQRKMDPADIGLFVDQYYTDQTRQSFKNVKADALTDHAAYWGPEDKTEKPLYDRGTPVTILEDHGGGNLEVRPRDFYDDGRTYVVTLKEIRHLPVIVPITVKQEHDELDRILRESRVTFATYGMMKEGIDKAAFDAGVDVTPRADGEQVIGRIRRPVPGKPEPVWYTIKDTGHQTLERWWHSRCREYRQSNCTVIEHDPL